MVFFGGLILPAKPAERSLTEPGATSRPLLVATSHAVGFCEIPSSASGITFTNALADERSLTNQILLNGSGVAAGDVDGDGWCDLYFCGLDGPNALYRNRGDWRFEAVPDASGAACADQASCGATLADVDGDGDLDLLVTGLGRGARLFVNDGQGRFTEATQAAGLSARSGGTSLALADIDGDGDLDLYLANYRTTTLRDEPDTQFSMAPADGQYRLVAVNGRPVTDPDLRGRFSLDPEYRILENGEPDVLYRNDGLGRFTAVAWNDGKFLDEDGNRVEAPYDWTLSAMFRDVNQDGAPDLYVCSDFQSEDRVWLNTGQGGFRAIPRLALRHASLFTMGVDFADLDRDGHDDFFAADMLSRQHALRQVQLGYFNPFLRSIGQIDSRPQYSRNMLFWNRGDGTYAEVAHWAGVAASDWTWCPVFLDVDLDGYEDLLLVTGHQRDAQNVDVARRIDRLKQAGRRTRAEQLGLRRMFPLLDTPNFAFRNRGDLRFEDASDRWGFNSRRISQGIALADLDGDGDLDVAINCLNDAPLLCRNETSHPRVAVRLRGEPPNTRGIGARVTLRQANLPPQSQEILAGGRYLSSDDPLRVFAVADPADNLTLVVRWRSGRESVIADVQPNRIYVIDERSARPGAPQSPPAVRPLFADVSALLAHRHVDEPFDDFLRQPLLPRTLSRLGPGVSWFDFDGDGWEDLLVGSGKGGKIGLYRNDQKGGFRKVRHPALDAPAERDQTTILGWHAAPDRPALLIGEASYENDLASASGAREVDLTSPEPGMPLPGDDASVGPLALADIDGDGDLDLFVGGRVRPGRYPEPVSSHLLRREPGGWVQDPAAAPLFRESGLVSGAIWTDLTSDGFPELALACDWGPIRLFANKDGRLSEWNPPLRWSASDPSESLPASLGQMTGWWNSIAAGDFDGDGRLDLVAGNWGRNTRYQAHLAGQLRLYYGDPDETGSLTLVDAYRAPELDKIVPWRDWETLAQSMPFLLASYDSFADFSTAAVGEFLGARLNDMRCLTVNTLDSLVLLTRGDHLEVRPLPLEAQLSPVFGLGVADFDGDGREDLAVAQNFFRVSPDAARLDAGRGLLLLGDGQGGFNARPAARSGITVYGEGRGLAVADFDHDGRTDVVVGQNGGETRLFRNEGESLGLRVRLRGPEGNPSGLGASLRFVAAQGEQGPAREVRAGNGYWSQDAAVQVLAPPAQALAIRVRWPGGRTSETPLAQRTGEIDIR